MRKTKIICTVGPASASPEVLRRLVQAGTDCFRLNMSHETHERLREIVPRIRAIGRSAARSIAILLDTQGPAIRTGDVAKPLQLAPGDVVEFTTGRAPPKERNSVTVNYPGFTGDVKEGQTIVVDNGLLKMRVVEVKKNRVVSDVLTRGALGSRRHINLPGVRVKLPALTKKDIADVGLGAELGVDFVSLSFVREKADLDALRQILRRRKSNACVVAKIENRMAVDALDDMIAGSDAIMVARGDLGIECPMEDLPVIQRRIVQHCLRLGKPVIVATQLLESMVANPLPTRAEITDVANAVFEQADALMLSGESAIGRYPVECVEVLSRVARRIERSGGAGYAQFAVLEDFRQKMVSSAVVLANSLERAKLIVFTRHGTMARHVANMRPEHAPIFAFTPSEEVQRQLSILWGVLPAQLEFANDPNRTIERAEAYLRKAKLAAAGDQLVIISDVRAGASFADAVQLRTAK